ncbi:MAG: cytochrome c oxidase subunit [Methylobacteriaceae bacterium]|jgi:cytochrome c oxidase subunit 2|nr:cytochrome c oxidase subunit [Methylobacteriaceae bacterium]
MIFRKLSSIQDTALLRVIGIAAGLSAWGGLALAEGSGEGHAVPGQMGFQRGTTEIAHEMHWFHDWLLLPITTVICLFVLGLLVWVVLKFNEKVHPVPSRTTHNSLLEVAWTVVPVLILVIIAIPSFRLLTKQLVLPDADITMKVTGKQWYWTYDYPQDQGGGFSFDSLLKPDADLKPGDIRLLAVDNEAVIPVGKTVRLQVTAADVIHSFVVQSFGARIDAVPGRLNETWFKPEKEGTYYGQCSKICGKDHAFMPIAFRVVSEQEYAAWLADAKKKFASNSTPVAVAAAETAH